MNKNNNIFDVGGRVLETKYSRITKVELLEISLLTGQNFIDEKMKSEIQIEFDIDEKNYLNNPIICFDHNWSMPPIGKVLKMNKKKGILEIDVQFSKDFKKYFGGDSLTAFYGECCVHSDGDVDFDENRARGFLLSKKFVEAFYNETPYWDINTGISDENGHNSEGFDTTISNKQHCLIEAVLSENLFVYLKRFLK